MELVILMGMQASGKSTFCQQRLATHVLVSKDRMRNNKNRERRQRYLVAEALRVGRDVVVDNTNPSRADREPLLNLARSFGARAVGYFFESDLETCRVRNAKRVGRACVPEVAFALFLKKLERPHLDEGFHSLHRVRLSEQGFEVSDYLDESTNANTDEDKTDAAG
jgi:predicted kinase